MAQFALYGLECSKDTWNKLMQKLVLVPRTEEDNGLELVYSPLTSPPFHFCQIISSAQLERYKGLGLYLNLRALFFLLSWEKAIKHGPLFMKKFQSGYCHKEKNQKDWSKGETWYS